MNMKKIIYLIAISLMVGSFTACEDKLEEENHANTTQDFMKTPKGFKMGLTSIYGTLRTMYAYEEGIHGLMNPGTDEIKPNMAGSNRTTHIGNYHLESFNTDNEFPRKLWNDSYTNINTLNFLIENAPNVDTGTTDLTAVERDQFLAEAKFFRGFFYFLMVEQFGDLTINTTFNTEPRTSAVREDMLLAYDVIIADLEDAAKGCSPSPQQNSLPSGRISAAAARHLLGKVYLTLGWVYDKDAAKYPNNPHNKYYNPSKAQEYYQKAYTVLNGLVTDAPGLGISLMPKFADVFDENNDAPSGKNKEELFVARMDWDDDNVYGGRTTLNHYFVNGYDAYLGERNINDGRSYSWNNPNTYTYNAFNNRDKDTRYQGTFQMVWFATKKQNGGAISYTINGVKESFDWKLTTVGDTAIYYPGYKMSAGEIKARTQHRGDKNQYIIFTPDAYNGTGIFPTITKFLDRTRAVPNDNSDRSYIIYRLAETYLLAAEAAYKLGNNADAARHINVVRERARNKEKTVAGVLDVKASDITLDFILEERTRELLAEHCRWADLARTGTLLERVKKYGEGNAPINIREKHILRPIPKQQIDRVTTGTPYPQNPGW
ncbi:putative outer membrane starch-binding protein [Dysgonomonas alginatilytica]|uniref:Putative outer membrane starch-binding protein n=2 Tax=Dysgonomonas alginatilytica TaxID=1605892 RepID=A0A2V3PJQ6_9BACT|nr:putative outer membrane starch-binding protein [Dysgonomonas alginatilytica]